MIFLKFIYNNPVPQTLEDFLLTKLHQHGFTVAFLTLLLKNHQITVNETVSNNLTCFLQSNQRVVVKVQVWPSSFAREIVKILYIDGDLIVVNKPAGIATQNDFHHQENTVATQIKSFLRFPAAAAADGIVHRLDKLTTGLLIVARHWHALKHLKIMFMRRTIKRHYYALVEGRVLSPVFTIKAPLAKAPLQQKMRIAAIGKAAESCFQVNHYFQNHTWLNCQLKTGRTHQIRAHLAYLQHPIVNDPLYQTQPIRPKFIYLHAFRLQFHHPFAPAVPLTFAAPSPDYFQFFALNNSIINTL